MSKKKKKKKKRYSEVRTYKSGSVTIIGDFWQPFCVGKIMAATRQGRGKRYLLDSALAVKLFARLTELPWPDFHDTCASSRHCLLAQKSVKNH